MGITGLMDEQGNWIPNESYQEIHRLDSMLTKAGIPHTMDRFMNGWQIIYPEDGERRVMDAIEHCGSYGSEDDLLEIMGLLTPEEEEGDSVLGHLTAEDVFERIRKHHASVSWGRYIEYLKDWAEDHKDAVFAGMSPASWDEWLSNEVEEE